MAAFSAFALLLHIKAREHASGDSRKLAFASFGCAILALSGGETALAVFGYVAAYELIGRREPLSLRLRALAPWGALFVAYAAAYKGLGFGVRGAGGYVDPITQTRSYLELLPGRLAVYLNAALLCVPSELSMIMPKIGHILAASGVIATLAFAALLRRAARALDAELKRTLAWLLVGALFALLPAGASIPGDRVLLQANFAFAPALSLLLLHAGRSVKSAARTWLARAGVALFALIHGALAPLSFAFGAWQLATSSHAALAAAAKAEIPVRAGLTIVGIGLADPLIGMYLPASLYIAPRPEPRPSGVWLLSMSAHDHLLQRTDDRTLDITIINGALLEGALESLFRPESAPLHAGERVPLADCSVRILQESAGRPTRFSIAFDRSLDDPSLAFVIWKNGGLRALKPPRIGEQTIVKHELGPMGL